MTGSKSHRFTLNRVHPILPYTGAEISELPADAEYEAQLLRRIRPRDWFVVYSGLKHPRYNAVIGIYVDHLTVLYYAAHLTPPTVKESANA